MTTQLSRRGRRTSHVRRTAVLGTALGAFTLVSATAVLATVHVGSPGPDVTFGQDRDNARNTFIQPPGVQAKQHLDGSDVVFGRLGDDLVGGRTGSDVLIGGPGDDITIGGPDTVGRPSADVSLGDEGNDVDVWGTGDGNGTFVGDVGDDTQVVGRLLLDGAEVRLATYQGREVPKVSLAGAGQSCRLTEVPRGQQAGEQYLLRVYTGREMTATIRLKDVEHVVCTSPRAGYARVADLTVPAATFQDVPVRALGGVVRAIVAPGY